MDAKGWGRDAGEFGHGYDGMGIAWGGGSWWMRRDVDVIVKASVMDAKDRHCMRR